MASHPFPRTNVKGKEDCQEYPEGKDVLRSLGEGGLASQLGNLSVFYTCILRSLCNPDQRYIGSTTDLKSRLAKHNKGDVPHTAKFRPWKAEAYFAFETQEKASAFEQYLKSGSGHAFAKRHF